MDFCKFCYLQAIDPVNMPPIRPLGQGGTLSTPACDEVNMVGHGKVQVATTYLVQHDQFGNPIHMMQFGPDSNPYFRRAYTTVDEILEDIRIEQLTNINSARTLLSLKNVNINGFFWPPVVDIDLPESTVEKATARLFNKHTGLPVQNTDADGTVWQAYCILFSKFSQDNILQLTVNQQTVSPLGEIDMFMMVDEVQNQLEHAQVNPVGDFGLPSGALGDASGGVTPSASGSATVLPVIGLFINF